MRAETLVPIIGGIIPDIAIRQRKSPILMDRAFQFYTLLISGAHTRAV